MKRFFTLVLLLTMSPAAIKASDKKVDIDLFQFASPDLIAAIKKDGHVRFLAITKLAAYHAITTLETHRDKHCPTAAPEPTENIQQQMALA